MYRLWFHLLGSLLENQISSHVPEIIPEYASHLDPLLKIEIDLAI